jgi:hypothetical protein
LQQEYFPKELEKNLTQHKIDERSLRYKLKIYQKKFPYFVYGNLTSIETLGQDEEIEIGLNGTTQEEEM